jgi:AraC-like DNA-binding protein
MTLPLLFLAIDVVAVFSMALVGVRVLVSRPRDFNTRIYALIALDSVCYVVLARQDYAYWIPPEFQIHVGAVAPLLDAGRNLTPGLFMLLCHSLFQDEAKVPRALLGAFAVQVLLEQPLQLLFPSAVPGNHFVFETLPALLQLVLSGFALYWVLRGWQADLIEPRRRMRWVYLAFVGFFLFVSVLLLRLLVPDDLILHYYTNETLTAILAVLGTVLLFTLSGTDTSNFLIPYWTAPDLAEPAAARPPDADLERLERAFRNDHIYREGGLSVGSLAAKLNLPEYRVRKLIHEKLGHRNFNALLHEYRLAEACAMLADPNKNHLPILTIALTVGYQSINPFNRAFKERKGITPSSFRAQAFRAQAAQAQRVSESAR